MKGGIDMKLNIRKLVVCIAVPLGVGVLASILSIDGMRAFDSLTKPALTPPGWVFAVVWTALYIMMGVASYIVSQTRCGDSEAALTVYGCQLAINFAWPLLFFRFGFWLFAFVWLCALWLAVIATLALFHRISKTAGLLILPYLLWVTFAGYLNLGVYLLN